MLEFLTVPLYSYLNRIRGGGWWADKLPGRPLFWILPIILATAIFFKGIIAGTIFAAIYGIWATPAWGRWYTLGRIAPVDTPSLFEKIVEFIPGLVWKPSTYWFDSVSFIIRNIITLLPALLLYFVGFKLNILLSIIFGISLLIVILYDIAWAIYDKNKNLFSIEVAELAVGALWALILIFSSFLN